MHSLCGWSIISDHISKSNCPLLPLPPFSLLLFFILFPLFPSSLSPSFFIYLFVVAFYYLPLHFRGTPVSPDALLIGAPVLPPAATRLISLLTTILPKIPTPHLYTNTSYQSLRLKITGSGALDSSGIKSPVPQPTGVRGPRGQSGLFATFLTTPSSSSQPTPYYSTILCSSLMI